MELPHFITRSVHQGIEIKTIEMHTTGEPTRIVYSGYPDLSGTLLEQREQAKFKHDNIRRLLLCEPRGHREMYGAVIRPSTELVDAGQAHMGVLFLTNDGYSTMCGHATLAVARLIVDHAGSQSELFSNKFHLDVQSERKEVGLSLHVPCGLVRVTVPIIEAEDHTFHTDPARPISYRSVPSYATGIWVTVSIPESLRWMELGERDSVVVDIAYGGAFYIIASPAALGFANSLAHPDLAGLKLATQRLKAAFNASDQLRKFYLSHPEHAELQFLYGTIVTETGGGEKSAGTSGSETSICYFSDSQVDRSPTGSGVQAKVALAHAKGKRKLNERWTYHSIISNQYSSEGAFVGEAVEEVNIGSKPAVIVKVSGWARYTGACTFVLEEQDQIGQGFYFEDFGAKP